MSIASYILAPTTPVIGLFHDANASSFSAKHYHLFSHRSGEVGEMPYFFYAMPMNDNSGDAAFSPDEMFYEDIVLFSRDDLLVEYSITGAVMATVSLNNNLLMFPNCESDLLSGSGWRLLRDGRIILCQCAGLPFNYVYETEDNEGNSVSTTVGDKYFRATNKDWLPSPYSSSSESMVLKEVNGEGEEVTVSVTEKKGIWVPSDVDEETGCGIWLGVGIYEGKTLTVGYPTWKSTLGIVTRGDTPDSDGHYTYGSIHWSEEAGAYVMGNYMSDSGWWEVSEINKGSSFTMTFKSNPEVEDVEQQDNITYSFQGYSLLDCPDKVYVANGVIWQ